MGPWTPEREPLTTAGGAVTLVEGSSFCISAPSGDLGSPGPHGVFLLWLPGGKLWVAPVLPSSFTTLRVEGVSLGAARISREVSDQDTSLEGVPGGVEVLTEPYLLYDEPGHPG
jgi:hypothetical protein